MNQILLPPFRGVVLTRVNQLAARRALEQILAGIVHPAVGCPRTDRRTDVVQLTLAMAIYAIVQTQDSGGAQPWSYLGSLAMIMSIPVIVIFLIFHLTLLDRMLFGSINE